MWPTQFLLACGPAHLPAFIWGPDKEDSSLLTNMYAYTYSVYLCMGLYVCRYTEAQGWFCKPSVIPLPLYWLRQGLLTKQKLGEMVLLARLLLASFMSTLLGWNYRWAVMFTWYPNSGPHAGLASAFSREQSPSPPVLLHLVLPHSPPVIIFAHLHGLLFFSYDFQSTTDRAPAVERIVVFNLRSNW